MGKRHHAYRAVFLRGAQPFREADERTGQPPLDVVVRKTFDPVSELGVALRENLQQRHRKARPVQDQVFNVRSGPEHQRGVFKSLRLFGPARDIKERRLAEQLVGAHDFEQYFRAVVSYSRYPDLARSYQIDTNRRALRTVDHLALPVVHRARYR